MVTKAILLFGGHGQVGNFFQTQELPTEWKLSAPGREECDFQHPDSIGKAMHTYAPELVINCAAMTDVDACENNISQALHVNFDAVATIAAHCVARDAPLIQLSTDYVFDGNDGQSPYRPDDQMSPLNFYGESKMMGEEAARHELHWHTIVRTSLVFSAYGDNALTRTLRAIDTQDEIPAAADQTANPTSAASLASALKVISTAILAGKANSFGTFHYCDFPAVSRLEFIQAIMDAYAPYTDRRPKLVGVNNADIPGRAPRPAYTSLDCSKTQAVFGIEPRDWREELCAAVKEYVKGRGA
jgi:dTDP-4-dehydrorhamnose reductase